MPNDKATAAMGKILDQTPVADDGAQVKRLNTPSQKRPDPSGNLGKFLHPKKDGSRDPNAAGTKVRPGY